MRTPAEVIGKTLEEILREDMKGGVPPAVRGLFIDTGRITSDYTAVFVLDGPDEDLCKLYAEELSLHAILLKHPELRQAKVEHYIEFFGEDVFRVRIGGEKDGQ